MGNKLCFKKKQKLKKNFEDLFSDSVYINNKDDDYFNKEEINYYKEKYKNENISKNFGIIKNLKIKEGKTLGTGAYGTVIFGLDLNSGLMLAIKTLFLENNKNGKIKINEIEREVELLSELNHKNIVKYIGSEKNENTLKIYLEYVENGTLSKNVSIFHPLKENVIRYYAKQILEGLEYLHAHNVVHMDIKGSNVLLDKNGICKLADFGASKKLSGLTLNTFKGTLNYMAPEVMKQTGYERYADIWSFGCTVYQMFTSKEPWHEIKTLPEIFNKVVYSNEIPSIPKNISLEAKDFLFECFQKDYKKRPNVKQLLNHPFIKGTKFVNDFKNEIKLLSDKFEKEKIKKIKKEIDELKYKKSLIKLKKTLKLNHSPKKEKNNIPKIIKKFDMDFDIDIKTSLLKEKFQKKTFNFEKINENINKEITPKKKKKILTKFQDIYLDVDLDKTLQKVYDIDDDFKLNINSSISNLDEKDLESNISEYDEQLLYYNLNKKKSTKNNNIISYGKIL